MCLLHWPLHIRRVDIAHHWALQTSWWGLGWLQGSTRNGMYRGCAHATGGSSQQGLLPEVYRTASTYDRTLSELWNQEPNKTRRLKKPQPSGPGGIYSWWCSASSANGGGSHDCSSHVGLLDLYPTLVLYLAGDALRQQPIGSRSHDCSSYVGCGESRALQWCRPMTACIGDHRLWHPDDYLTWGPKVDSGPRISLPFLVDLPL